MARYRWIVQSNCTPGNEATFERWYRDEHIPDLRRVPGIVDVEFGRVAGAQTLMTEDGLVPADASAVPLRYLAIYHIESDDPAAVLGEVIRRADTPDMMISTDLIEVDTALYEMD